MIDTTTKTGPRRRLLVGVIAAVATVGVLTGCTVSGEAGAPQAEVAAYRAQQAVKRQKANALMSCLTIPMSMRQSVDVYNEMIRAFNASGGFDQNLVNKAVERIDDDIAAARTASNKDLPEDLKKQLGKMIVAREAQRGAVLSRNATAMNNAAREMNNERDGFTALCKTYIG